MPEDPEPIGETIYGTTEIYKTKHYITYGGGPEGGYMYFYKERFLGWYRWHREGFQEPTYTKIETGQMAFFIPHDGSERMGLLPDNWVDPRLARLPDNWAEDFDLEALEALGEAVIIADDEFMQAQDEA